MLRSLHPPAHRVQRGEQLILRVNVGSGQRVQQCRFAGVGIAYQRNHRRLVSLPVPSAQAALLLQFFQFPSQLRHPFPDAPPVHLQLALARSPRPDASGQPAQRHPLADQPRAAVLQLRQLHLQLAFGA